MASMLPAIRISAVKLPASQIYPIIVQYWNRMGYIVYLNTKSQSWNLGSVLDECKLSGIGSFR